MKIPIVALLFGIALVTDHAAGTIVFQDNFQGGLAEGWMWVREDRSAWRVTTNGLEVLVQPGNMWGSQNNARNILVRRLPDVAEEELELAVTVENQPTHQYEQANLVWYYDDSHMVKIGQELVDGQLSIVMGREEADQCRTIAIIPLASDCVRVRFIHQAGTLKGSFQLPGSTDWRPAGECTVPAPKNGVAKASLQFYQGPRDREHWAKVRDFIIRKSDG